MAWYATGGMTAVSVIGGIAGNAEIAAQSAEQQRVSNLYTEQASGIAQNDLQQLGINLNQELGMALTKLAAQSKQRQSIENVKTTETNTYGNMALRKQAVMDTKLALSKDSMMTAADNKMVEIQTKMRDTNYETQARYASAQSAYNNSMSQQSSTLDLAFGAASAGLSGYSMGSSITADNAVAKAAGGVKE